MRRAPGGRRSALKPSWPDGRGQARRQSHLIDAWVSKLKDGGGGEAGVGELVVAVEARGRQIEQAIGELEPQAAVFFEGVAAGAADFYAERAIDPRARASAVLDVVYDPWPTPLASAAAQAGIVAVSGFDLLLHQAARQVELMTGREPAPLEPSAPPATPN